MEVELFPLPQFRATAALSPGLAGIPHLDAFLPETRAVVPVRGRLPRRIDSLVARGTGPAGRRARRIAERRRLPLLTLEDGFIRSLGRAADGFAPCSLIVDPLGVHYDATRPSALEAMLEADDGASADGDVITALARLRGERLGRTNAAPELGPGDIDAGGRPLVLVVDQARDDPSIGLGLAGERSFETMLDAAVDENPHGALLVVLPRAVASGRGGHLAERAHKLGIAVLDHDVNAISLVEQAARVYTVTDPLGMEALICGARVTCFGMPYYAGWGATDDRVTCARRTRRHSPLEIFAAAYLRYARYVDPITGAACSPTQAFDRLAVMKRMNDRNRGHTECLGFERRARRAVRPFLASTEGSLGFSGSAGRALRRAAARRPGRLCVWAGRAPSDLDGRARGAGVPLVRVDQGILDAMRIGRTGADGASLAFDRRSMYAHRAGLSELEETLEFEEFDRDLLARAARLRTRLVEAMGRRDLGREEPPGFLRSPRRRILVVGAEADPRVDRGVRLEADLELLRAVGEHGAEGGIVFLPGDEPRGRSQAQRDVAYAPHCDHVLRPACRHAAIACADEVHTATSPLGFEALLRGCRVVTYGAAFYAGWGLTEDRLAFPRRRRRLTLDQLVAGALLLHPSYVDPVTRLPCDAETVVERLAAERAATAAPRSRRFARYVGRLLRGMVEVARQPG